MASPPHPPPPRVILHMDMDSYYVQVERRLNGSLMGRPVGIQQKYLVVTASHEARARGVTKLMGLDAARAACPDMIVVNGEDLTQYRRHSDAILDVLNAAVHQLFAALRLPSDAVSRPAASNNARGGLAAFWSTSTPVAAGPGGGGDGGVVGWKRGRQGSPTPAGSPQPGTSPRAMACHHAPPSKRPRATAMELWVNKAWAGGAARPAPAPTLSPAVIEVRDEDEGGEPASSSVAAGGGGECVVGDEEAAAAAEEEEVVVVVDDDAPGGDDLHVSSGDVDGVVAGDTDWDSIAARLPIIIPPGPLGPVRPAVTPRYAERLVMEECFVDVTMMTRAVVRDDGAWDWDTVNALPPSIRTALAPWMARDGSTDGEGTSALGDGMHIWSPPTSTSPATPSQSSSCHAHGISSMPAPLSPALVARRRVAVGGAVLLWLRRLVATTMGMTCCGGVGASKMVAKLLSGCHKPNQQTMIWPEMEAAFMMTRQVADLPGVGWHTEAALRQAGVSSVSQLVRVPGVVLASMLPGDRSAAVALVSRLQRMAHGTHDAAVVPTGPPESVSDEDSFKAVATWGEVLDHTRRLGAGLLGRMQENWARHGMWPSQVRVGIRLQTRQGHAGASADSKGEGGWNGQRHTRSMPLPITLTPHAPTISSPTTHAASTSSADTGDGVAAVVQGAQVMVLTHAVTPLLRGLIAAATGVPSFDKRAGCAPSDVLPVPLSLLNLGATGMKRLAPTRPDTARRRSAIPPLPVAPMAGSGGVV